MRDWLSSLSGDRVPEVALGLALGYAFVSVVDDVVAVPVSVLAQHVGRDPSGEDPSTLGLLDLFSTSYYLNFSLGGTVVVYGQAVSAVLALAVVTLTAVLVARRRARVLGSCPLCASLIPYGSTHCAYCGSGVAPGEP